MNVRQLKKCSPISIEECESYKCCEFKNVSQLMKLHEIKKTFHIREFKTTFMDLKNGGELKNCS